MTANKLSANSNGPKVKKGKGTMGHKKVKVKKPLENKPSNKTKA